MTTASLEKKMVARPIGSAWTCFHALFLNSIWVMRLVARIAPIGRKKIAIDSHEFFQRCVQKPSAA